MERCSNCGAVFSSPARLCANCGQAIAPPPLPIPPQIPSSQQVPMVPGAPSPFNVPALQDTPGFSGAPTGSITNPSAPASNLATNAASAPSVAPSAAHPFVPTQPFQPGTPGTDGHYHQQGVPAHWSPYTLPSHMPYSPQMPPMPQSQQGYEKLQPPRKQHMQHTAKAASKTGLGLTTKWVLIAIISIVVVAGGASAFVLASHSHTTGLGGTPLATSSHSGATSTACIRQGDGPACPGMATSTPVGTNLPIGDFIVTGTLTGTFVSQIAPECNQLNKGNKENFILTVINGTLNGTAYQLGFFTPYSGPGVYHQAGTDKTVVFLVNKKNSTGLANLGKLAMTIAITNGGHAGFLDADLGNLKTGTPVLGHVTGQYSCSA